MPGCKEAPAKLNKKMGRPAWYYSEVHMHADKCLCVPDPGASSQPWLGVSSPIPSMRAVHPAPGPGSSSWPGLETCSADAQQA